MTLDNPSVVWFGTNESPPAEGNVLVLNYHHDGESHWCSPERAIARIEAILDGQKPEEEWGPRMEAMKIVPYGLWVKARKVVAAWAECEKVRDAALAEREKVRDAALAEYEKVRAAAGGVEYPAEAWAAEWKEGTPSARPRHGSRNAD